MPLVSAELTDGGVITSVVSSLAGVRSPARRRMAGARLVTGFPLQSVILTLTGRTWPFLSLSVTDAFVMGGMKMPVPM